MTTVGELLRFGSERLQATSPSPRLDAELILQFVSELRREFLLAHAEDELSADAIQRFHSLVERRAGHEPVAYLTGEKEFWGLPFLVTADVLIPRPETELIVEKALALSLKMKEPVTVLDLGTGSGALALAIAYELEAEERECLITAVDLSSSALEIAEKNCARFSLQNQLTFLQSDWFSIFDPAKDCFDIIVANPPYIAEGDIDLSPETRFEPRSALFSGTDGLDAIRVLLKEAPTYLRPGGSFLCELGASQQQPVSAMLPQLRSSGIERHQFLKDLAGIERVLWLSRGKS